MTLADRVAIVAGAGHGIGKATAGGPARAGAHVALVDIDQATAEKTAADVTALAVFLASPGVRNITGQSFNVDGGIILD